MFTALTLAVVLTAQRPIDEDFALAELLAERIAARRAAANLAEVESNALQHYAQLEFNGTRIEPILLQPRLRVAPGPLEQERIIEREQAREAAELEGMRAQLNALGEGINAERMDLAAVRSALDSMRMQSYTNVPIAGTQFAMPVQYNTGCTGVASYGVGIAPIRYREVAVVRERRRLFHRSRGVATYASCAGGFAY